MSDNWKRSAVAAAMLAMSQLAHAGFDCDGSHGGFRFQTDDSWFGTDKLEHFGVSAPFGALGAYVTRDSDHPVIYGALLGTIPGVIKETIDGTCHTDGFSYKDLTADAVGALTGALLTHWIITYNRDPHGHTIGVAYTDHF